MEQQKATLLIIRPKVRFKRWVRYVLEYKKMTADVSKKHLIDESIEFLTQSFSIVALTDLQNAEQIISFIESKYMSFVAQQLLLWSDSKKILDLWPKEMNLKLFNEWFYIEIHKQVFMFKT
jgi:hypothetical protein